LDELEEAEAKASLIWIIGEYADKIDNADVLLGFYVDAFTEESYAVSLFLRKQDPLSHRVRAVMLFLHHLVRNRTDET